MEAPGGMSDGGIGFIQPWQIPHRGGGGPSSSGRGIGQAAGGSAIGASQGLGSTGMGGTFAQAPWPGRMAPAIHRGMFGGEGIRTGGAY